MKRLDLRLVELGLAPTRSKAQKLIEAGEVEIESAGGWKTANQSSLDTTSFTTQQIRVSDSAQTLRYVSRGGLKLEKALDHLQLVVDRSTTVLDVGLSTGGFSDCLLQRGAGAVIGIDVGHGQLAASLASDPRLKSYEGLHIKELESDTDLVEQIRRTVTLCVVDVSFISLTQIFPVLARVLPARTRLLALVKPQFEVGLRKLDAELFPEVQAQILLEAKKCGFSIQEYFASGLKGQDGNQEFFVYGTRD